MTDVRTRQAAVPWSLWRLGRFVFDRVIRTPIASGRLKDNGWPPGLKGIVVAWAVLYVVMMTVAVFSALIRRHSPLLYDATTTLPLVAFPLVAAMLIFALTCLYTAGLHLVWWLRVLVTLVVVAFLLRQTILTDLRASDVVLLVAAGLLVVLLVVRWGRAFHWLEFVVALVVIGHGVLVLVVFSQRGFIGYGADLRLNALAQLAGFAWSLAVPVALVAGAAVAELTVSTVAWTVTGVWQALGSRRRWAPAWGVAVLAVLFVLRAVQVTWHVWHGNDEYELESALPSMAIFVVVVAACAVVARRADRARGGDPPVRPDPDDLIPHWSRWSMVLALFLAVAFGGSLLVANVLKSFGLERVGEAVNHAGGPWQFNILVFAGAVVGLCLGVVLAGRGRRAAAIIVTAASAWWICIGIPDRLNLLASAAGVSLGASFGALGVFFWLLARRRLTGVRGAALATVLLLSGVYEYRTVLEEPLTALFSLVGLSAAVLVGLIWRMLTDSGYSRGDSRRFPRPSRVLIALASTTYAVTSLGVVSLVGGYWPYDVAQLEYAGDVTLGFSIACAAFFAGLSLAARGRLVHSDQPRDDYGKLVRS